MKLSTIKVLVAGGAGFIGSQTANRLASLGYKVVVVDNLSAGQRENLDQKIKFYLADIRNKNLIGRIFKKERPDIVMNFAAKVYWHEKKKDSALDVSTSVLGTINLLESCLKYNVKKIIFSSSISLYEHSLSRKPVKESVKVSPENLSVALFSYAATKYMAEQYIQYFHEKFSGDTL